MATQRPNDAVVSVLEAEGIADGHGRLADLQHVAVTQLHRHKLTRRNVNLDDGQIGTRICA